MKEQLRLNGAASLLSLALLLLGTWVRAQNNIPTGRRAITIADIIETTWVETHGEGSDTRPHPAWFSPDGKKFVVSLTKGNVKQNTNDTTLLLYNTADVLHSPKPDILTTMSSSSSREGINEVRWTDNNTLVFLGEEPGVMPQIYTLNVETKHLEKLTSESKRITMFDITPDGHEAVYKADLPLKNGMSDDQMRSGAVTITDQRLGALLKGIYAPLTFDAQLFAQQHNRRPRLIRPVNVPPTSG